MVEGNKSSPREDRAQEIGRSLGQFVRKAHDAALEAQPAADQMARRAAKLVKETVEAARPEAEHFAQEAIEASRPAVERAARYVRDHEEELRQVGGVAGEAIAWRMLPRPLRPFLGSAVGKFFRQKPPKGS
ncbi:MAG TPA: hypothetical protein DGL25_04125 [Dehalococcoidia bacterium]|nr:hypothetical protein [Dehalococcoidia bacterium]